MVDTIATLQAIVTADVKGLIDGLAKSKKQMAGFGATAGGAMAVASKAIDVAIDAVQAFGDATVGAAVRFDKSLKNIQSVTGQTSDQIKALGGDLMNIGANSVAGVQAVTDAYYDVASGVTDAAARMATLKAAVALSEAGNASLAASTSALISIMNSYAFSADKASFASDVLTRTVGVGVGTMEEFSSALGPISGLAAKVGVDFKELGAASAYLTTKGASASQAATRLQATMTAMLNPNAKMIAALRKSGFTSGETAIKQLGLVGALNALYKASGGSADKMAQMMGSVEALQAATALAGPEFAGFAKQFEEGLDGATAAAQKVQLGSFDAQWKMFTNSLGAAAQAVGMLVLPALNALIGFINSAMGTVGKFAPLITDGISKIAGIFKPLLDEINRVTAPVQQAIANIKGAFDKFFSDLFADTSISAAGQRLSKKLGETITPDKTLQEKIGPAFAALKDTIAAELGKIDFIGIATGLINAAASFGENLARNILKGVLDLGGRLISSLQAQFGGIDIGAAVGKFLSQAQQTGMKWVDNLLSGLGNIVDSIGNAISSIDTVDIGAKAGKFLADALAFGAKIIKNLIDGLLGTKTGVEGEIGTQLDGVDLVSKAGTLVVKALQVGQQLIGKLIEGIGALGASFGNAIVANLQSIDLGAAIQGLLTAAGTNARNLVNQFVNAIGALGHDFGTAIATNLQSIDIGAAAKNLLDGVIKIGTDIINSVVSGIKGLGDQLIAAIGAELDKVIAGIQDKANAIGAAIAGAITGTKATVGGEGGGATKPFKGGVGAQMADGGGKLATGKQQRAVTAGGGPSGGDSSGGEGAAFAYIEGFEAIMEQHGYRLGAAIQTALDGVQVNVTGITAKLSQLFSGADIANTLTNLSTVISGAIATAFGADGAIMTALKPFEESWALTFGAGGTLAAAAIGMQGTIDGLTASIVSVGTSGVPAIMEFEAVSTSAAPTIAGAWQPVVGVFRQLLMVLEGIAGAAQRATGAMGAIPGVGGGGGKGYASGGYTGSGPSNQVAGMVHRNEYVVPQGGALVMRSDSGGSGGAVNVNGPINVYGVQNVNQLFDELNRVRTRRNA